MLSEHALILRQAVAADEKTKGAST
jgi:hypothetical protein